MSSSSPSTQKERDVWKLAIGAIGVVYGDIGTSPLYAFREAALHLAGDGQALLRNDLLGILSLIIWTLMIIVTFKYVSLLLSIDNKGEGGTLALMTLARSLIYRNTNIFLFLGMAGAALFYGDAVITPAISVLSAVEGLKVVTPAFGPYVLPITIAIIFGLFLSQSKGTEKISRLFGPITTLWFIILAALGLPHVIAHPEIMLAINPYYALLFLFKHGGLAFIVLGSVFLCVTGAEALYTDLGHFGKRPIRLAWGWVIFPALVINYLGQGALLLDDPSTIDNPFFKLSPTALTLPLVFMSTLATIIASQAVITGAYSLTRQAVNLRLLPRISILHTSAQHSGQIYMPHVTYILMIAVIFLIVIFKSSGALASAYGISVTGTMLIDALLVFYVAWQVLEWPLALTVFVIGPFILIDSTFLSANLLKLMDGGWVPLMIASGLMIMMMTWIKGSYILYGRSQKRERPLEQFVKNYQLEYPGLKRVEGTAIYMAREPERTPRALLQNLRHNKVLHNHNILLSVTVSSEPFIPQQNRTLITRLNDDFTQMILRYGFMEMPDVQSELMRIHKSADCPLQFDWEDTTIFVSRRTLRSHPSYGLPAWQDWLYIWMHKNSAEPTDYYRLPVSRVVEIGHPVLV